MQDGDAQSFLFPHTATQGIKVPADASDWWTLCHMSGPSSKGGWEIVGFAFIFGFYVGENSKCEKSVLKILGCSEKHVASGADGGELGLVNKTENTKGRISLEGKQGFRFGLIGSEGALTQEAPGEILSNPYGKL